MVLKREVIPSQINVGILNEFFCKWSLIRNKWSSAVDGWMEYMVFCGKKYVNE